MSDFLTRMAQRSIGAAPLIAPHLPSLFAPVEESPIGNVSDTTVVTNTQSGTQADPALQSRATGRIDSVTDVMRASVSPTKYSTTTEAMPETRIAPDPAQVESTLIPLVKAAPANFQTIAPLLAPDSPQAAALLVSPTAVHKQRKAAAATQPLLPQRRIESAAHFAVSADTPAAADTTTPAPPTVHITIGRVEVRANIAAAAPPAAPRPRPTSQPALSLSDYLKRGAGAS